MRTSNPSPTPPSSIYSPETYRYWAAGAIRSAEIVVPKILELVPARSVVDVGSGIGAWSAEFLRAGVETVRALDGDHVDRAQLLIPAQSFASVDLASGIPIPGPFDLAISLEVAEHLPPARSTSFIRDLTRLSSVVVFSAAAPEQTGTGHVQEQWPGFWVDQFASCGFVSIDCLRPLLWNESGVDWWYRQNMFVAVARERLDSDPSLQALATRHGTPQALVHPENLLRCAGLVRHFQDLQNHGLRNVLRALPRLLLQWPERRRRAGRG